MQTVEIVPPEPKHVPVSPELLEHITGMDGAAVEKSIEAELAPEVQQPVEPAPLVDPIEFTDEEERAQAVAAARTRTSESFASATGDVNKELLDD
jgi:hypothetical protein